MRLPEDDGGAVVAAVMIWRQREDDAVHQSCGDADGDAGGARAIVGGGAGETHDARRDVAVEVDGTATIFSVFGLSGGGGLKFAGAAQRGQNDGEAEVLLARGALEGDV